MLVCVLQLHAPGDLATQNYAFEIAMRKEKHLLVSQQVQVVATLTAIWWYHVSLGLPPAPIPSEMGFPRRAGVACVAEG